uniref:Thyroglobulin n=1 Tax=Caligus clemensi TaxID=344056 RepID=C1C2N3_CALCM|nr:Thyroglobulin precursor [Caligus clemensi]
MALPISKVSELPCYRKDFLGPCGKIIRDRLDEETDSEEEVWYGGENVPRCSPDGYFHPIQVDKKDSSTKFCSDRNGKQIKDFRTSSPKAIKEMHCRCALAWKYLDPKLGIPKCCQNGNYECWQCQKGFCYCVDQFGRQVGLGVRQIDVHVLKCQKCCSELDP